MRWRMRDKFEDATLLHPKIRAYWDLTRPFTLLAPFIGGIVFGLMALVATDGIRLDRHTGFQIFYSAVTLTVLNAGSNAINQAADAEIDAINKPYRPVPSGMVSPLEAESIGYLLWIAAIFRALVAGVPFFFICLGIILCSYHYSLGKQLKKKYIANNMTIAISRGFLGPWAAWTAVGDPFHPGILSICLVFTVYTFGATVFKDLPDVEGDRKFGSHNFVTQHGPYNAVWIGGVFMASSHGVLWILVIAGTLPLLAHLYHFNLVLTAAIVHLSQGDRDAESAIENRRSWVLMYLQMILMMVLFLVVFIYE